MAINPGKNFIEVNAKGPYIPIGIKNPGKNFVQIDAKGPSRELKYKAFHKAVNKVNHFFADTFVKSGAERTAVKTAAGYGAAAASGGLSGWLAHKFLPEKLKGNARKAAVAGAGAGGALLPAAARQLFKLMTRH